MTATTEVDRDLTSAPADSASRAALSSSDHVRLVPDLFASAGPGQTLQTVTNLARRSLGCDGAGVILTVKGGNRAAVASGTDAARADAMQVEYHEGPAYYAIAEQRPIESPELRFDSRWRFWGPKADDLGFRSAWSLALTHNAPFGALTLYSRTPSFFRSESIALELGFAQRLSIAIAVAVEREQLVQARDSQAIVGQAQGILMERHQVPAEDALEMLRRHSSLLNRKLRLVAEGVVRDRRLPELGRRG